MCDQLYEIDDLIYEIVIKSNVEDIESLYQTNHYFHSTINKSYSISLLCLRFRIPKQITSFYNFLIEYNHRYRRSHSYEQDLRYHLQWAINDQDILTAHLIIDEMEQFGVWIEYIRYIFR